MAIGVDDSCHTIYLHKEKTDENKEKSGVVQRKKDKDSDKKQRLVEVKMEAYTSTKWKQCIIRNRQISARLIHYRRWCFSHDGAHVITGGVDMCARCWMVQ